MSEALFRALGGHNHDGGHGSGGEDDDDDDGADIARVTRWTYDPAGNRIEESKDGRVTASTYSPANEILTAGPWRYENDLRGNQVSRQKGGGDKERFVYNVANMLMSYGRERRSGHGGGNDDGGHGDDDDDGQPGPSPGSPPIVDEIERYFYAPSFERVGLEDVKAGELTNFLWRDGRPIEEFVRKAGKKEDSAQGTRYSWALGLLLEQQEVGFRAKIPKTSMDFLLGEAGVAGKDREALLADHLGSIRLLTDDKGKVTERTTWGPWGELLDGGEDSRFGFTGHQRDRSTGLHYSVFRFLDSGNGRWSEQDPIGFAGGQSNLYGYVGNNPLSGIDPLGLANELEILRQIQPATNQIGQVLKVAGPGSLMLLSGGESGLLVVASAPVMTQVAAAGLVGGAAYGAGTFLEPLAAPLVTPIFKQFIDPFVAPSIAPLTPQVHPLVKLAQDLIKRRLRKALNPSGRSIGDCPNQAAQLAKDLELMEKLRALDVRVNQAQATAEGVMAGLNRPDLQGTIEGLRVLVEYDNLIGGRGAEHAARILANDQAAAVILRTFGW